MRNQPSTLQAVLRVVLLLAALLAATDSAQADKLIGLVQPGQLIFGHAKYEDDCEKCHKSFDKSAQSGLCKDCHKEIAEDLAKSRGYHGLMKEQKECNQCHTEHEGRDARIAKLNTVGFDHMETGFELKGGHLDRKVLCRDCHSPLKKYRQVPVTCVGCHRKDDKHKGSLGTACANCHDEKSWKSTHFDHSRTKFPLSGKHEKVKCLACHPRNRFQNTPTLCNECHKKDDKHKGRFGPKCEVCHTDRDWKEILFDHDKQTKYNLLGKHRDTKCVACHKGDLYRDKLKTDCYSCHRKDDKHKGRFGIKCETCHSENGWKQIPFDHDRKTKFILRGKHRDAKCVACHKGDLYRDKLKMDCYSCHRKDDKHEGQEGKGCQTCHNEQTWKKTSFNHLMSRYPLIAKHLLVECRKCHASFRYKDAKTDCWSCHSKQDVHKGAYGVKCENCHNTRDWKGRDFDHDKTDFKLQGKHSKLRCAECHTPQKAVGKGLTSSCVGCHDKDDQHDGNFGVRCEHCHETGDWKTIRVGSERRLGK
ncbi:MAG: cytochrome C [Sideroxydans sp.]|nr:cytochrome C [Sideroxydans sp.]